jgi:hypothetical protein
VSSTLLAFKLATPVEVATGPGTVGSYDPLTQTSTWEGGTPALAVHCSPSGFSSRKCNAYGTYCSTFGSTVFGYVCDS